MNGPPPEVFERDCLVDLGTCVAPAGQGKPGEVCATYEIGLSDGAESGELQVGALHMFQLDPDQEAAVTLHPESNWNAGAGPGQTHRQTVKGGAAGLILDGRGRPIPFSDMGRAGRIAAWNRALDLYPRQQAATRRQMMAKVCGLAILGLFFVSAAAGKDETSWQKVQRTLLDTKEAPAIVLEGTERAPAMYSGDDKPQYGDWMVRHFLSDPENFNPYVSNDSGASTVHQYIFESLLDIEDESPYNLRGLVAKGPPAVSEDKLTYTFDLREDVHFADGKPLSADDVLFSIKVIKNPEVLAASLRNYFAAISDVEQEGKYRISFVCREPYFRNNISLGSMEILPKHFYDPDGLLDPVDIGSLIDGSWESGPHAERVQQFAEKFNTGYHRKMLGSGPYLVADWDEDVVTGQKVILTRNPNYWGGDRTDLMPKGYVEKIVFKIVNDQEAAFIELTNGNIDYFRAQTPAIQRQELVSGFYQAIQEERDLFFRLRVHRMEQRAPHLSRQARAQSDDVSHRP